MAAPDPARMADAHTLRLVTLGRFALVAGNGAELVLLGASKQLALLAYLALVPGRAASRDHLVELLWADVEPERARQSLRQALTQIRARLGPATFEADVVSVRLATPLASDRDDLFGAIDRHDFDHVVRLYRGPFIPEFAAPGGAAFEHWADLERVRIRSAWLLAAERVIRAHLDAGRFAEAERLARQVRDDDRTEESAWRLLLETLAAAGRHHLLHVEFEALRDALRREGTTPSAQLQGLVGRLSQAAGAAPEGGHDILPDLVGRQREFAELVGAMQRVAARREPVHVHVLGAPGIGKTRLLQALEQRLRTDGTQVAALRASAADRGLPYGTASDLARALSALPGAAAIGPESAATLVDLDPALAARFAGAGKPPRDEPERRRLLALTELLGAVAEEHPTAVLLDDLHWTDPASAGILLGAVRRVQNRPLLLVTSGRPGGAVPFDPGQAQVVELSPLDRADTEHLVESLAVLPAVPWAGALVDRLQAVSGGSPFLLVEMLRLALGEGHLVIRDGQWACPDPGWVPRARADDVIERRLATLTRAEEHQLRLLGLAGLPLSAADLSELVPGLSTEEAIRSLRTMETSGLAIEGASGWRPSHDRIAEAALRGVAEQEVAGLQRDLGRWLGLAGRADRARLRSAAAHLREAGDLDGLGSVFARAARDARASGRAELRALADWMLGPNLAPPERAALRRAVPWLRRVGAHRLVERPAWLLVGALAFVFTGFSLAQLLARGEPPHLSLRGSPIGAEASPSGWRPAGPLTVEVRDRDGRLSDGQDGTAVTLEVVEGPGTVVAGGRGVVTDARAVFDSLVVSRPGTYLFRAVAEGLLPDTTPPLHLYDFDASRLRIVRATLGGQTGLPAAGSFRFRAGAPLDGTITIVYSSYFTTAAVLLAAVPTWGDRRTSAMPLLALPTPAHDQTLTVPLAGLRAPSRPGRYPLILVAWGETEAKYLASGTNWVVGDAVWNDGNDVVDWGPDLLARARDSGYVTITRLRQDAARRDPPFLNPGQGLMAAVLDLEVTP